MAKTISKTKAPFGKWLRENSITLTQVSKDTGLAYRTVWLAAHGAKVGYDTADRIRQYTDDAVSVDELCSGIPRSELPSVVE
jgi:hypothetical protein